MVLKLFLNIVAILKKMYQDSLFTKSPKIKESSYQQGGKSGRQTSIRHKIGSLVSEWECLPCSGSFSAAKKFPIADEALKSSDLLPRLTAHHGIPATACIMSFDPVLNLFATATKDGCIKILGDAGIEMLLQSPGRTSYRFLQFVHNQNRIIGITTKNDVELWDIRKRSLAASHKWAEEITSVAVIQGSPFMYVGDETGAVHVLQYDQEKAHLLKLPYSVNTDISLGEGIKACRISPVNGILPQPHGEFTRVLIAYEDGLIVLWHLQRGHAIALRGGPEEFNLKVLSMRNGKQGIKGTSTDSVHGQEDKELSCVCWTCSNGSLFAAGYTDGDVWLWNVPPAYKPKGFSLNGADIVYSKTPVIKLQLGSGRTKVPIFMLKWWADDETRQGRGGHLCVFGGGDFESYEVLKIISLKDIDGSKPKFCLELPLHGPLTDLMLVPNSESFPSTAASLLVLTSPGNLCAYPIAEISEFFIDSREGNALSLPEPVAGKLPISESHVTVAKFYCVQSTGKIADDIFQIPRVLKGSAWPFIGTKQMSSLYNAQTRGGYFYITGHHDGSVNIWDVSTTYIYSVCCLESKSKLELLGRGDCSVSCLDFCSMSGFLAVGYDNGLILLYKISNESHEVNGGRSSGKDGIAHQNSGFHLITNFNAHQAPICCIVVSATQERLAAGCKGGMVSLIDLKTNSFLYLGKCFPNNSSEIISLHFAPIPLFTSGFLTSFPPATPYSMNKRSSSLATQATALFVTTKDANMAALHGNNGVCLTSGSLRPKRLSTTVSLYLIDSSGAPVAAILGGAYETLKFSFSGRKFSNRDAMQASKQGLDQFPEEMNKPLNVKNKSISIEKSFDSTLTDAPLISSVSEPVSNQLLLLLCSEDCLHLYSVSSFLQGIRAPLFKSKLHRACCWTSTFQTQMDGFGLILLYKTGELEIRSLPGLSVLKVTDLSTCIHSHIKLDQDLLKSMSCTINGRIALINCNKELIFMSLLDEYDIRVPFSTPPLQSKCMSDITEAPLVVASQQLMKKRPPVGMVKETKDGMRRTIEGTGLAELAQIFGARDSIATQLSSSYDGSISDSSNSLETRTNDLDIDDTDIDNDKVFNHNTQRKGLNRHSMLKKVKQTLKGQKKDPSYYTSDSDVIDYESSEDGNINTLKGINTPGQQRSSLRGQKKISGYYTSDSELMDYDSPGDGRIRSLDEIKASYGHRSIADASGIASHARDKLFQRGEKMNAIAKNTTQMQQNAKDFQSLAEELVKTYEKKKWGF
eukprot:c24704_g1_i1 orf=529-4299(-)